MAIDTAIILAGQVVLAILILVLLLRRPGPEAANPALSQALTTLQASLDRQGERLAALPAEIRAEIGDRLGDLSRELSGFAIEQAKLLNDGLLEQRGALAGQERAVLDRLAADATVLLTRLGDGAAATQKALTDQREQVGKALGDTSAGLQDQVAALRRDTVEAIGEMRAALAEGQQHTTKALQDGLLEQRGALAGQEKSVLEKLSLDATAVLQRLAEGAAATQKALTEQREQIIKALGETTVTLHENAAALRRDVTQGIGDMRTALAEGRETATKAMADQAEQARNVLDQKLTELRESNEARLVAIEKSVNEHLQSAVEKQMNESFNRVIDQFAAVQKAMGDVQAVTAQIGDIKRIFSNVKTRGGWAETQVKALLDDILAPGGYETNMRLREDSQEVVEFAVRMPTQGGETVWLPVDAKFPIEDFERLCTACEAGDAEGEARARAGLQRRIRDEAAKIASKYINPPRTVEFAVLYLPTEGLYAEVARVDGLLEELSRMHRIVVLGPSLLPMMLRTIQLGHVTFSLGQKADQVRELLGAAKSEMEKMEKVLGTLAKQVGTVSRTIESAQVRTRAVSRKLRGVDVVALDRVNAILALDSPEDAEFIEEDAVVPG